MIDRVTPARRPARAAVGTQRWRRLLFLHTTVDPALLRPLVPPALELDLFEGRAYVGLVPFAMERVRPRAVPAFLGMDFLETNVRTYVLRDGQPGVWFFSLEAASRLAVHAARATFGLPYFHARMAQEQRGEVTHYRSARVGAPGASMTLSYRVGPGLGPSLPGTLQHFLIERYLLYALRRGTLLRGQVHHAPYAVQSAEVLGVEDGLLSASGLPPITAQRLATVHFSPGVDVEVFAPERC